MNSSADRKTGSAMSALDNIGRVRDSSEVKEWQSQNGKLCAALARMTPILACRPGRIRVRSTTSLSKTITQKKSWIQLVLRMSTRKLTFKLLLKIITRVLQQMLAPHQNVESVDLLRRFRLAKQGPETLRALAESRHHFRPDLFRSNTTT